MTHRQSFLVPLLTVITCGLYFLYWQYVTTKELKEVSGREDLNPMLDLIITFLCFLYGIYVQYRNTKVVHEVITRSGKQHEDKSTMVLIMHALNFVTGFTGLVGLLMVQDEYNKLAAPAA